MLVSIPGIADTTAAAILAELLDVTQFAGARQVAAFAGLVPRIRQSGSSVRGHSSLSKIGSSRLRKCLYFPAMVALRFNPAVRDMGARLSAGGKSKLVIIGAAMRKLLQIAFGVLKSGRPFDPHYCPQTCSRHKTIWGLTTNTVSNGTSSASRAGVPDKRVPPSPRGSNGSYVVSRTAQPISGESLPAAT